MYKHNIGLGGGTGGGSKDTTCWVLAPGGATVLVLAGLVACYAQGNHLGLPRDAAADGRQSSSRDYVLTQSDKLILLSAIPFISHAICTSNDILLFILIICYNNSQLTLSNSAKGILSLSLSTGNFSTVNIC